MAKLSEKIGYGLGDFASSMFWKIFSYYLPIFYSDVFGLKPVHAATLLLITKLYDAVSDPVMGIIADRTDSKWGKYRPYLLWMAIPFAVIGVLSFYVPGGSYGFKHVYAYVMYILMMTAYTAVNVPYGAMLGVMTEDSREKSVFSSFRMFFAYIGSFIAMGIFWVFEKSVIGKENAAGRVIKGVGDADPMTWTLVVAIVGAMCAVLFIGCFLLTREHVKAEKKDGAGGGSIGKDLRALASNGPWWLLLGAAIGQLLCGSIRGGAAAYYFANILNTNIFLTCAIYLTIGEIAQMIGVTFAVPLSEKLGKRNTFIAALATVIVFSCAIWFVPVHSAAGVWVLIGLQILVSLAFGLSAPLTWSMFADVADYSELRNGAASTGLIFSSSSMAQKFGGAIGGFLLLALLGAFGYDKGLDVQAPQTLGAIKALMSFIPAIGALAGIVFLCFYPLTTARMKEIQTKLAEARKL
ncbi:MAG: MFS transporter [Bacteroidales bacterium]|nr:MFS transporter [Bacteroidales bacterium]